MFRILIFLKAFEQQMMSNCFIWTYPALIVQLLITFAGKIVVDFSQIYTSFFFSWYQYNTKENSEKKIIILVLLGIAFCKYKICFVFLYWIIIVWYWRYNASFIIFLFSIQNEIHIRSTIAFDYMYAEKWYESKFTLWKITLLFYYSCIYYSRKKTLGVTWCVQTVPHSWLHLIRIY